MGPLWIPNRAVVFRVRVVRDVRAKLCASYPANRGLVPDPCPTAPPPAPAPAVVVPVVSRWRPGGFPGRALGVSQKCPGGVPVVSRWCSGGVPVVSRWSPAVAPVSRLVSWLASRSVSRLLSRLVSWLVSCRCSGVPAGVLPLLFVFFWPAQGQTNVVTQQPCRPVIPPTLRNKKRLVPYTL